MAVPLDLSSLEVTGAPFTLLEVVRASTGWGKAEFAVSNTGTLVYIPGGEPMRMPERVDLTGEGVALLDEPVHPATASLSADGTRVAIGRYDEVGDIHIWVLDLRRDTRLSRLTIGPGVSTSPTWTPDGEHLLMSRPVEDEPHRIRIVYDWFDELTARAPVER
jgi:hypothetical protein